MELQNLPKDIVQQIALLTKDQQFQKRFGEDKELDKLDEQKHNQQIQFLQLQLLLHKKIRLYGIDFNPITVALFSYLYSIRSPVILKKGDITVVDLNIFFYLLQTKDYNSDIGLVLQKSMNYCKRVLNLTTEQATEVFNKMYKIQFRVLSMFPSNTNGDVECLFNVDWALNLISKVKELVSYTTEQLYKDVSIMQIYYYFADYCRNNGSEAIFIRTEQQILFEEDKRVCQLVLERLVEKNVIKKEQVDKYLELMITKSQEK